MILKNDTTRAMFLNTIFWYTYVFSRSAKYRIILYQHPIMQNCDTRRGKICSIIVKPGSRINDIVSLPLAGFFTSINEWRMLFIYAGSLSVSICTVVVAVEDLNLITFL